jgi:hypothetical protein
VAEEIINNVIRTVKNSSFLINTWFICSYLLLGYDAQEMKIYGPTEWINSMKLQI